MAYNLTDSPSYIDCSTGCLDGELPIYVPNCPTINGVQPEVIALWFLCGTTLTNNWATAADIITDLTAVPDPLAVGNKLIWGGKQKKERTLISRAAGLPEIATRWSQGIEFFSDYRSDTNADYIYYNNLIELSNNAGLNFAYITQNDDIYYYRGSVSLAESDDLQELEGIEKINITVKATGAGTGMTAPIKIAGLYAAIAAAI
jgi:hypothetical protein